MTDEDQTVLLVCLLALGSAVAGIILGFWK